MMECDMISSVFSLFSDSKPVDYSIKNTSHGDTDFRETVICDCSSGNKLVLKIIDNEFTSPDRISIWKRCADEYKKLGYYCPKILSSKNGTYPRIQYKGHTCVAYAEEYSAFSGADSFDPAIISENGYYKYIDDAIEMIARVASMHFNFAPFPSAWCAFEKFCPSDKDDEVTENATNWLELAKKLPDSFSEQVERIWKLWNKNKEELKKIYPLLPTSVFQADLNKSNILLDRDGRFKGVFDFNLCGKEVVINYLFREAPYVMTIEAFSESSDDIERNRIFRAIRTVKKSYRFQEIEIHAAPLLYRYQKPLWYPRIEELRKAGNDTAKIEKCLSISEKMLTDEIDWASEMK